ncbi:peptidase S10 [Pelagerythrobacter marensis]|uniref:Peptidase S10 n=1 Tax=Pelagerythrobacter marensis TaxID=543877 RepID=A0ABZ2D5E4_9SPHN
MTKTLSIFIAGAALVLAGCASASQDRRAMAPACAEGAVRTVHSAVIGGKSLDYAACAGTLTVRGDDGEPLADLFYTAYLVPGARDAGERPLTFVWNGGPGADSRLLHFEALGPRVLKDGALVDNAASPLDASDLVFLDPADTGFSRTRSAEARKRLYSTVGDIAATTDFIVGFRLAYGRTHSPLFLIGESFGTWRAAGVAERLADRGESVAGIGLISGGIPLGDYGDRALMRALSLPGRTASAAAHGRLAPELQSDVDAAIAEAEEWAREVWHPALADPAALDPDRRKRTVAALARYHGIAPSAVDADTLWISPRDFRTALLADEGLTLNVFDMRKTGQRAASPQEESAVLRYYNRTLGYQAGDYAGIEVDAFPVGGQWQYDQAPITEESLARAMAGEGPPSPSRPWTLRALQKMPAMRVFVAAGLYDSLNSCAANEATVATLPRDVAPRIRLHCYRGGHMMYDDPAVAKKFGSDVRSFLGNPRRSAFAS